MEAYTAAAAAHSILTPQVIQRSRIKKSALPAKWGARSAPETQFSAYCFLLFFALLALSHMFWVLVGGICGMFMCGILHTIFMVQSKVEPPKLQYSPDCNILSQTPQGNLPSTPLRCPPQHCH